MNFHRQSPTNSLSPSWNGSCCDNKLTTDFQLDSATLTSKISEEAPYDMSDLEAMDAPIKDIHDHDTSSVSIVTASISSPVNENTKPTASVTPTVAFEEANNETTAATTAAAATTDVSVSSGFDFGDLDIILLHEDFPKLLTYGCRVKLLRNRMNAATTGKSNPAICNELDLCMDRLFRPFLSSKSHSCHTASNTGNALVDEYIRKNNTAAASNRRKTIPNGLYPITDYMMHKTITAAFNEYTTCEVWLKNHRATTREMKQSGTAVKKSATQSTAGRKRGRGCPNNKPSKHQSDILNTWIFDLINDDTNDDTLNVQESDIEDLVQRTGMSKVAVMAFLTKTVAESQCVVENDTNFLDFMEYVYHLKAKSSSTAPLLQDTEQPRKQKTRRVTYTPVTTPVAHDTDAVSSLGNYTSATDDDTPLALLDSFAFNSTIGGMSFGGFEMNNLDGVRNDDVYCFRKVSESNTETTASNSDADDVALDESFISLLLKSI